MNNRRRTNNFTYVSSCVKYMIFTLNFVFWVSECHYIIDRHFIRLIYKNDAICRIEYEFYILITQLFGGLLIGVGLYAFVEKWQTTGSIRMENVYDVVLNISLVMVIAGGVVFVVSFAGCIGALRENTCLLKFVSIVHKLIYTQSLSYIVSNVKILQYSLCLLVFFLLEMGVAIVGFVFPHTLQSLLEESFTEKIIQTYREDIDLQNFIDFGQQEVSIYLNVI